MRSPNTLRSARMTTLIQMESVSRIMGFLSVLSGNLCTRFCRLISEIFLICNEQLKHVKITIFYASIYFWIPVCCCKGLVLFSYKSLFGRQGLISLCLISTAARKRQRRDKDRAWDMEERERRGSGEHRKSGQRDSRRGSGSRYRDSSDEESPPPSMSEGLY